MVHESSGIELHVYNLETALLDTSTEDTAAGTTGRGIAGLLAVLAAAFITFLGALHLTGRRSRV